MKIAAILSLGALLSFPAIAQQQQPDITDYHVLLVPVFSSGPGVHGSQWETSVSVASVAENVAMPVPLLTNDSADCGSPNGVISHHEVRTICADFASPSGLFLYVPKTFPLSQLYATSRVRDTTRQAASAGTAIPIVRPSEFHLGPILLPDIPSDARFRTNLRIYAGPSVAGGQGPFINTSPQAVSLEIFDSREIGVFPPLASAELEMSLPEVVPGSPFYVRPGYLSIADLVAQFPQLASVPRYTIRLWTDQPIVSPPVDLKTWAFVTITNNDTQEVTTVTP
jgi:hypothetical protein